MQLVEVQTWFSARPLISALVFTLLAAAPFVQPDRGNPIVREFRSSAGESTRLSQAAPRLTSYGSHHPSPDVEDPLGLRDYLFRVGIDISRDPYRRPRSAAVSSRCDAFPGCGTPSLWLDARAGRAIAERA